MFLRNWWYSAAESREVGREPLGRVFLGEPVVLYRKEDGTAVALEDQCCHRRAPLHLGKIEGDSIRCNYHGFLYEPGGRCVWVPGQSQVPPNARVDSYRLCERHGWIWIWMGEADRADESLVPDFHQNTDPNWSAVGGLITVEANHMLLVDNLLDLSHLAFLHAKTIGSEGDTNPDLHWEREGDELRGTRLITGVEPSARMRAEGIDFQVDQTKVMIFTPPANVVIHISTRETGFEPGESQRLDQNAIIFDAITPESDARCHYFWANVRDYGIGDADHGRRLQEMSEIAFNEDKEMLEAQQINIDRGTAKQTVDIGGDSGALQAMRIVDRLLTDQQRARAAAE